MFSLLLSKGLKPAEIAELTLCEALLYTLGRERESVGQKQAEAKAKMFARLPLEHKIQLAYIRSEG